MFYIARSTSAETGTMYRITRIVPATAAALTVLHAWVAANSGNAVVGNPPTSFNNVDIEEGQFIDTSDSSIHKAITYPVDAARQRAELQRLMYAQQSGAKDILLTADQRSVVQRLLTLLVACINIDANVTDGTRFDIFKLVVQMPLEELAYHLNTAEWNTHLSASTPVWRTFTIPSGGIASNNPGTVSVPSTDSGAVVQPTKSQYESANVQKFIFG